MKPSRLTAALVAVSVFTAFPALGQDRYGSRPPVVLSPDLAAPWVMQLRPGRSIAGHSVRSNARKVLFERPAKPRQRSLRTVQPQPVALRARNNPQPANPGIDPIYLPQEVAYSGPEKPGTIIVDTSDRFLYFVQPNGTARRYGVGVGKEGFSWSGSEKISRKAEWPSWRPPAEMIARERKKGRILPAYMEGGPQNPLGARALYLGSTLYRIHGTNQPWTIGQAVSSGCIRMRNEDVTELYARAKVGAKVIVR
ncbi:L,D-transpeptidase [Oricola cellulosilytica]|uniref:L,D-transpeptidase n=1 Tax=Oricola cellulosilytica TaxID=1429082 RepID=A0A4R0PG45_9HYPH|nr:L,D-transpeptidase [Oricola cellulosilytica]TCD16621.1 L,D-transpeptidase [Oricola cellulosilytica]